MTVLSKRARRFIDAGVLLLTDSPTKAAWGEWSKSHPVPKGSFRTQEDEPFPRGVLDAAIAALSLKRQDLIRRRDEAGGDDTCEFENDISYVHFIEVDLAKARQSVS